MGTRGGTWRNREVSIKVKQSNEECVAVGWLYLKLDHYTPRLRGSAKYLRALLGMCNSSINKVEAAPNYLSL